MGRHALGSNVRDAACYVLWAFARAYEPEELKSFIETVATSLMCVALFDREVNLRRAASAAFQENVGRQANFPDGVALLTIGNATCGYNLKFPPNLMWIFTADYFAVGNRLRCYTKVCVEVVRFPKYAEAIVDHLLENKIVHWDEVIREQAAIALGLLAPHQPYYLSAKLDNLLCGCNSPNPVSPQARLFIGSFTFVARFDIKWI
ncbi:hypothetical protein NECAME_13498 [Necator americanus]|uniref:Tubulin-folding cofactor D ARM repeats domain-containing protein n=1 Tax=Necator americanus TaxID=51031 RepID=W2SUV4_NECAM|nr:hypothetical protein NECAME_13498 [Necator americanus]ETN73524.1 hypothetical protein NECAME_13498 [Necator americanus]